MRKSYTFLIISLFTFLNSYSQNLYWPSGPSEINTGINSTYIIQQQAVVLNGQPVLYGYNLGAFYLNDNQELTCGGINPQPWTGSTNSIAVMGDDTTTPEKDGFSEGEEIIFFAIDTFNNITYDVSITYSQGSSIYTTNGFNAISEFSLTPINGGCMDENAFNYNELATIDDGSCINVLEGCTDNLFVEYNPNANTDNGSCITLIIEGCTNPNYTEYNTLANTDDGSCSTIVEVGCMDSLYLEYASSATESDQSMCINLIIEGCMNTLADNYNPLANVEGYCEFSGCTDTLAFNFDSSATLDDGSCIPILNGCTDELAFNYNPLANTDDGSCSPIEIGCTNELAFNYNPLANTDDESCLLSIDVNFSSELTNNTTNYNISIDTISIILGDSEISNGDLIGGFYIVNEQLYCAGFSEWDGSDLSIPLWEDDPDTEEIDGITEETSIYWIAQQTGTMFNFILDIETEIIGLETIFITDISVNESTIIGCLNQDAFNYNNLAFIDDGSCIDIIEGCTNELACNFNPEANTDDGSCNILNVVILINEINSLTVETNAINPSYSWTVNGTSTGTNSGDLLIFFEGEYIITITDENNECSASDTILIEQLDLEKISSTELILYPNPSNNIITVECKDELIESIQIYSTNGQLLTSLTKILKNKIIVNRKNLKNGMYFIKMTTESGRITLKKIIFK